MSSWPLASNFRGGFTMKGYKEITEEIITKLKGGTIPWRQTWKSGLPTNAVSMKPYRGINVWLLHGHKYSSNLWITFNQAKLLGGYIKKGEHGRGIVFWQVVEKLSKDELGDEYLREVPLLRIYTVFNIQQTTVEIESEGNDFDPIDEAQRILDGYIDKPEIVFGEPSYNPNTDRVTIPAMPSFESGDEYYSTLFHELSHSTGHKKRLNRDLNNHYGSGEYAEEEVIAEMSASYLSSIAGIQVYAKTLDNTAAYIQHWVEKLKGNERLIVTLSSKAQLSSDWITGKRDSDASEPATELE
jgi:antirestriction protein ArdC